MSSRNFDDDVQHSVTSRVSFPVFGSISLHFCYRFMTLHCPKIIPIPSVEIFIIRQRFRALIIFPSSIAFVKNIAHHSSSDWNYFRNDRNKPQKTIPNFSFPNRFSNFGNFLGDNNEENRAGLDQTQVGPRGKCSLEAPLITSVTIFDASITCQGFFNNNIIGNIYIHIGYKLKGNSLQTTRNT